MTATPSRFVRARPCYWFEVVLSHLEGCLAMADDHARRWLPELRLRVYVDDLKSTLFGDQGTLACEAPLAAGALVHALESVHLQDSRGADGAPGGKSRQLASTAGLRMRLKAPLTKLGIGVVDVVVYFGMCCAPRGALGARGTSATSGSLGGSPS